VSAVRRRTLRVWHLTKCFTLLGVALMCLGAGALSVITVTGSSMEETMSHGDRVLVFRSDVISGLPWGSGHFLRRQAIVVLRDPVMPQKLRIKRIVAVGGDGVRVDEGTVNLNGRVTQEPRSIRRSGESWPPVQSEDSARAVDVPPGHYFVLSDNRQSGGDSRVFGTVRDQDIIGRVICIWRRGHSKVATE